MDLRSVYQAMAKHLKEIKREIESGGGLVGLCKECKAIAPGLNEEQRQKIFDELKNVDLETDDFNVLKK